ncbi:MAG: chemotaxis protein CheR [Spirochaetales bacterium]|jgi:chemotaxis protein methyltransferase CheR|nr:chemotaxis protein CheR [Spirochaetales bacterium]
MSLEKKPADAAALTPTPASVPALSPADADRPATADAAATADSPALGFLYQRAQRILGIRPAMEDLARLRACLEERYGVSCCEDAAFCERLFSTTEDLAMLARFLTVNETYFFREPVHFRLLARHFLPRLAKLRRPVRVCSAATSSGCEAYSLAMVLDFYSRERGLSGGENGTPFVFEIDAFDVNPDMIEIARAGRYTDNAFREDGSGWKFLSELYLKKDGQGYRVSDLLRGRINFFTHNVMNGLCGIYDIIFFRNALIYFSPENRAKIFSIMAGALHEGGVFIPGVSETPSVEHPLLESRQLMDAFYFKKRNRAAAAEDLKGAEPARASVSATATTTATAAAATPARALPVPETSPQPVPASREAPRTESSSQTGKTPLKKPERFPPVEARAVETLLEGEEGLAEKVLASLREAAAGAENGGAARGPSVNGLAAAVIAFLGAEDTGAADTALAALEEKSGCAATAFLRGEYHYHRGESGAAEASYQEAAGRDSAFWPAFYRLSFLAAGSNQTRGEYKIRKALESIGKGENLHYEVFIGGFSPDYYRRILERKAAGETESLKTGKDREI